MPISDEHLHELLYQALETERGGVEVYQTALRCVQDDDLRKEWEGYLDQTTHHVEVVESALRAFGLDPATETPGRTVVRHIGTALVQAMDMALAGASPDEAEVVAAECVTLAETKDHLNWELIGEVVGHLHGDPARELRAAHKEVEEQEDEHLYHNTGGPESCGSRGSGSRQCCPLPRSRRT